MVSTSARNAGGPWFDSRSRHDRLLYANSVCLYIYRKIEGETAKMAENHIVIFYLYLHISKIEDGHFRCLTFYFSVIMH